MISANTQQLKNEWRKKSWTIPDLRGGKLIWVPLVFALIQQLSDYQAIDMDTKPQIPEILDLQTWRVYTPFLKYLGLVKNEAGILSLSSLGESFAQNPSKEFLANIIHDRLRLFGEVLQLCNESKDTIEGINQRICDNYSLDWSTLHHIRKRTDWLEVLGLIEAAGNRQWQITETGKSLLENWVLITPDTVKSFTEEDVNIEIPEPPEEINSLLQELFRLPELHRKRSTYNIWAPSPNRIQNLRTIIQYATERIEKAELFSYIENEFNLKTSSVESMLPFLKVSGLLEEVGRGIYVATSASKAWIRTGRDLDFIRILHCKMRFVGEMILYTAKTTTRNDLYLQAKKYGLNTEKARWIAGFLIEAGLLEEPQYLHIKATKMGNAFVNTLPLSKPLEIIEKTKKEEKQSEKISESATTELDNIINRLIHSSKDPAAENKASGLAFEEAISDIFSYMGFYSKHIGGSGDTDVVVQWKDKNGKTITSIVDGKSKSSGHVVHNDISDIAIETHKEKNSADYVAIVGAAFSGETIINHAKKKCFSLITATELSEIAKSSQSLGLELDEIALLFKVPNGVSQLGEIISQRQRELDIISRVISHFRSEQDTLGELSPRDMFLLLRNTEQSPSMEELLCIFEKLSNNEVGVLVTTDTRSAENRMYGLRGEKSAANRLRALAKAIDDGLTKE